MRRLIYDSTGSQYDEKTVSRPHQLEGTAFALYKRRSLLLYWMRLGKSKMALDWSMHLRRAGLLDRGRKGLILAHAPIACQVWRTQAALHSDLDIRTVESYQDDSREDQLLDALDSDCDLIVMPPTTVQLLFTIKKLSRKEEPKLYPNRDWLKIAAHAFSHAIIDEIHIYSNPWALRTELVRLLITECKQRVGLTGTPIGRNPFDIWAQAALIDDGATFGYNFPFFREAFSTKKKGFKGFTEMVFDKRKMPAFQDKLGGLALAYGKDEVRSAEVFAGDVALTMPEEQAAAYEEVIDKAVNLDGYDEIEIKATFHRLRQVAAGYLPFDHDKHGRMTVHFDGSVKLRWLAEMLDTLPAGIQLLIFHEYTHSGELICKALAQAKLTHAWLRGGDDRRGDKVAAFQSGEAQVLVAQSRVGGTSLDLPQADYVLMFECPVSPRDYEQAIARPMARGDRPLMLDHLIAAPVDRKILAFIKEGRDLSDEIIRSGRKFFSDLRAK